MDTNAIFRCECADTKLITVMTVERQPFSEDLAPGVTAKPLIRFEPQSEPSSKKYLLYVSADSRPY
jgi:hypothetical protein